MFAWPALALAAERSGFKEVRKDTAHAQYLKWLFPEARFVFIYRDPLEAFRSNACHGRSWYAAWPSQPVFTGTAFDRHSSRLVNSYLEHVRAGNGMLIACEELIGA